MLRGRRHHLKARVLLPFLGGGGCSSESPGSCGSPPLRYFLKHLLGSAAAFSGVPTPGDGAADPRSLALHFLRKSCGLSEDAAAKVAARVRLRSTRNAHAVLAAFRGIGFSGADLARVVAGAPTVLASSVDRTLRPKLDFYLRDVGLTDAELRRIVLSSPHRALCYGLDRVLRPNHALLRDLLGGSNKYAVRDAVSRHAELVLGDPRGRLLPKVQTLRDHGVPEDAIARLVVRHPSAMMRRGWGSHFAASLAAMKEELGVSPSSGVFPYALVTFARLHTSGKWKRRVENYLSLGWTEEQVKRAFVKHPYCMTASEEKVRRNWGLLAGSLGWSPEYVAGVPMVLSLSHDKWLLPRCAVLDVLASRGVVVKGGVRASHLRLAETTFVERYVTKYQDAIPQVLEAYRTRAVGGRGRSEGA